MTADTESTATITVTELAIHLSREDYGLHLPAEMLECDAQAVVSLGKEVRQRLTRGAPADDLYVKAADVLRPYGARPVYGAELGHGALGARLWGSRYPVGVVRIA